MEFARAGHEVILLFGTGTVLAGDPSERDTGRKLITQDEIDANIQNWKAQVAPIIDFDLVTIKQNGDWLLPLTLKDIIKIASNISATQLFKRESFQRRIARGDVVWYHETMYPLLQGYDSVVMDVDLEIGGTDQEFNMLVGRELQKKMNNRDKYVLTTPMILGTDGKTMSKTSGNCIFLDDPAPDMYQKIMSVNDDLITTYFELLTDIPEEEINALDPGNPVANKQKLARSITSQFHSAQAAKEAEAHFASVVQAKGVDENLPPIQVMSNLYETLKNASLGVSNSEIKRIIEQGGVEVDNIKLTDWQAPVSGTTIKFGRHLRRRLASN